MEMRRFELVDGSADKFWSIGVEGARVVVHYGRNGTNGQVKEKTHADAAAAAADAAKQVAAKVKKGYAEGGAAPAPPVAPAAAKPAPTPASAPAPAPSTPTPSADAAPAPEEAAERAVPEDHDPGDIGFRWHPLERAALPEGAPLPAAEPAGSPDDVVARCEAAVAQHVVADTSDYRRHEWAASPPFAGVPDEPTARWWRAYMCEHVPQVHEDGGWRSITFGEWQVAREAGRKLKEYGGHLDPRERRRRAREVVLDPTAALPPPMLRPTVGRMSCHLDETSEVAIDVVTEGRASVVESVTARASLEWVPGVRALLPDLTAAEVDAGLARAAERWAADGVPRAIDPTLQPALLRSALLATPAEHAAHVAGLTVGSDGYLSLAHLSRLVAAAVNLPDPEARLDLWERVVAASNSNGLEVSEHSSLPSAFAIGLFGLPVFERAVAVVCAKNRAGEAIALAQRLAARVDGPGAVPGFLTLLARSKAVTVAREWLTAHRAVLATYEGPLDRAQRDALGGLVREIVAVDPGFAPRHPVMLAVLEEVRRDASLTMLGADGTLPGWWTEALAAEEATPLVESKIKVLKRLPSWVTALPPLRVADGEGEARLDAAATAAVLGSAMRSAQDPTLAPRPLVAAVRERMAPAARDAFGSGLLGGFLGSGAASGERALFLASGFLGAEGYVAELTPLVRAWPGESQHQRAVLGLDALAATGTNAAMQAISGIAGKSKFKGVQKAANESLQRLADLQGLTVEEFEDRVVPDAGLDERGVRVLDYGPRQFRVGLGPDGKPVVHALGDDGRPTGKPRTSLPAPNSKDDAELAAATKKEFSVLRKQLTDVASIQTGRLERAMVTGRVWAAGDHAAYVLRHPVLNSLVRPLVWRLTAADGSATLVRVTEDREYVTVDEDPVEPGAGATVALAHPLTLDEADKAAWRTHLLDYELTSPVEQLDRAVFGLPTGQSGVALAELPTGKVGPGVLASTLERHGWRRGQPQDAGVIHAFSLALPTHGVGVVLEISDGLWAGMLHESGQQKLDAVSLVPLSYVQRDVGYVWWHREDPRLDWATADPVVVSEVRRTLAAVASRMEDA
ncbi:MAG TPA: DUF4132 domain-containing protein [Nocardioides sp.]